MNETLNPAAAGNPGSNPYGISAMLAQTDAVGLAVIVLLVAMSVASWYFIAAKSLEQLALRRAARQTPDAFWGAADLAAAEREVRGRAGDPFAALALAGVPGYESEDWFGVLAPAGTPLAIRERVSKEMARILALPEVLERFSAFGAEPVSSTPQVFDAALLRRAYASVDLAGTTDDASVIERLGEPVLVVEGDPRNIKITSTDDLALVRAIMNMAPPPDRAAHLRF